MNVDSVTWKSKRFLMSCNNGDFEAVNIVSNALVLFSSELLSLFRSSLSAFICFDSFTPMFLVCMKLFWSSWCFSWVLWICFKTYQFFHLLPNAVKPIQWIFISVTVFFRCRIYIWVFFYSFCFPTVIP